MTTKAPKQIINKITIRAPITKVWSVLTETKYTQKYMFGCSVISDWSVGSPLLWQMTHEGKELIVVKGDIEAIQKPSLLTYTVFDPLSKMEDKIENYLHVTYELSTHQSETLLKVTQGDYSLVAEGERRYQEAWNEGKGWSPILEQIKKCAEDGNA
jgi:uncharacterized protein YndB with AHSA1/START domain